MSASIYISPDLAKPIFPLVPDTGASTKSVDWAMDIDGIQHIDDPSGEDRRLFEGWASLGGIDYQGHEIEPGAFEAMALEYLAKNPVLLWDHIRHLPIGTIHELIFADEGLYIKGEIWRFEDIEWDDEAEAEKAKKDGKVYVGTESIGKKCNEVWFLIKTGKIRGLSVRGKARQWTAVYSVELRKQIPRISEILLYEISVTPTQVHPGAKIVAVNTLAKSLEICKGLSLEFESFEQDRTEQSANGTASKWANEPPAGRHVYKINKRNSNKRGNKPMDPVEKLREALGEVQKSLGEMGDDGDSIEIPEDVAALLQDLGGSVEFQEGDEVEKGLQQEPVTPVAPAGFDMSALKGILQETMAPISERLDALEKPVQSATPAKPTARIRNPSAKRPTNASPKPTGAQNDPYSPQTVEKALIVLSNSKNGCADMGKGHFHGCGLQEAAQLTLLDATLKGKMKGGGQISLEVRGQELLQHCATS
jgi:hypothetical protein